MRINTTLTYINLPKDLDFNPLSGEEQRHLKEWAEAIRVHYYSDLVLRLILENEYHVKRYMAYQIIEQEVLDLIVQQKMEEKGWSWT